MRGMNFVITGSVEHFANRRSFRSLIEEARAERSRWLRYSKDSVSD